MYIGVLYARGEFDNSLFMKEYFFQFHIASIF